MLCLLFVMLIYSILTLQDLRVKTEDYSHTEEASESETSRHLIESVHNNLFSSRQMQQTKIKPSTAVSKQEWASKSSAQKHLNLKWNTRRNMTDVECSLGYTCVRTLHSSWYQHSGAVYAFLYLYLAVFCEEIGGAGGMLAAHISFGAMK